MKEIYNMSLSYPFIRTGGGGGRVHSPPLRTPPAPKRNTVIQRFKQSRPKHKNHTVITKEKLHSMNTW